MRYNRIIYLLFGILMSFTAVCVQASPVRMGLPRQTPKATGRIPGHSFPVTGSPRVLVILANFQDVKFTVEEPREYFDNMLNSMVLSEENPFGSARKWLSDNSNGSFTPQFDIVGPVTVDHAYDYYGGNNVYGTDRRPLELIADACRAADPLVDFSEYDLDGDSNADYVYVYYAGPGESTYGKPATVWPHSGSLLDSGISVRADGTTIDIYSCSNEWLKDTPDGIGPFLHQFLTFLGVPPLGDGMNDGPTATPGSWSVMDTGCYNNGSLTPPAMSAFERMTLGWIEPRTVTEPESHELAPLIQGGEALKIPCGNDNEYFLLEYRIQKDWDTFLPNHGLLVWHIDVTPESLSDGYVNRVTDHHRVRLLKPNGTETADMTSPDYEAVLRGWCLPGTTGTMRLDDFTDPQMRPWSGERLYFPLYDVCEDEEYLKLYYNLGDSELVHSPVVHEPEAEDIGATSFTLNWDPVEGADRYLVSVYPEKESRKSTIRCDFGGDVVAEIPLGWSVLGTSTYTTPIYCGQLIPSLRFKDEGAYVLTQWTEEPVTALSFWLRGVVAGQSTVAVSGTDTNGGQHLISEIPLTENGTTYRYSREEIPEDIHQLQWRFHRMEGSAALDDILIGTGETIDPIEGFDRIDVGNVTTCRIEGLPAETEVCRVAVCAVCGHLESPESEMVNITLNKKEIRILSEVPEVRIDAMTVNAYEDVIVRSIDGREIGRGRQIGLPGRGVYIISGEKGYLKVVL